MSAPDLKFERLRCVQCGALNEKEAETRCTQTQDISGEYTCQGEFDEEGYSVQPTAASLREHEDWFMAALEREYPPPN